MAPPDLNHLPAESRVEEDRLAAASRAVAAAAGVLAAEPTEPAQRTPLQLSVPRLRVGLGKPGIVTGSKSVALGVPAPQAELVPEVLAQELQGVAPSVQPEPPAQPARRSVCVLHSPSVGGLGKVSAICRALVPFPQLASLPAGERAPLSRTCANVVRKCSRRVGERRGAVVSYRRGVGHVLPEVSSPQGSFLLLQRLWCPVQVATRAAQSTVLRP